MNLETYTQEYSVYTGNETSVRGVNIYTYLRAKRSSQKDCLLIAYRHGLDQYNMTYHLAVNNANTNKVTRYGEITTVLALMKHMANINWLSRDIIFFGYDGDFQYGTAIRYFLEEYYEGNDPEFIRGGVIRQAMSLEFKNDDFNTYVLQLEGNSGKLNDMDVVTLVASTLKSFNVNYMLDDSGMIRRNAGFQRFNSVFKMILRTLGDGVKSILNYFETKLEVVPYAELDTTLDFWRNTMLGRSGDSHSHLLDYAIHAFTLKGCTNESMDAVNVKENVEKTCAIVDTIIQAESDLDEQLHAGSYFYFPTSKTTFQSSNLYMYPIILCLAGFVIPQIVVYYQESKRSKMFYETTIYFIMSHSIGLIHLLAPTLTEKVYSFITGRDAQFREELPEPIANTDDTKYMVILWFFILIATYQLLMGIIFPFIIIYTRFRITKNCKDEGVLSRYWRFMKHRSELIDRGLLKNYLTFYEAIYTMIMLINNYPFAVLNVISLQLYLHVASRMWNNSRLKNIMLIVPPLLIWIQLCFTFYNWSRYLPMVRYMLIEYQTTGGGMYFYMLFNFCTYAQDIYTILI